MSDLASLLLTGLINHGEWLLAGVLFLAALGVPLPASMLLLAAGAFARQGVLDPMSGSLAAWAAAVAGDLASYTVGRLAGNGLPAAWTAGAGWRAAADAFARRGVWAVLVTRFLLTPMALPVNLLAGSTRFPWPNFLWPVVLGEALWVALLAGLGYFFADRWERVSAWAEDSAGVLLGLVLAGAGLWVLLKMRRSAH